MVLSRTGHQAQLDLAEVCNDILDHQEPVIFHAELKVVGKVGALGEEHEVGQRERPADNLILLGFLNGKLAL